jgi:hypothetical protein
MKRLILFILLFSSLTACVKKTDWPITGDHPDLIIVDGILTDEQKVQVIRITHPVSTLNAIPEPVSGANVVINTQDSTYQLTEQPANSGLYVTNSKFSAVIGKTYSLLIFLNLQCGKYCLTGQKYQVTKWLTHRPVRKECSSIPCLP